MSLEINSPLQRVENYARRGDRCIFLTNVAGQPGVQLSVASLPDIRIQEAFGILLSLCWVVPSFASVVEAHLK